MKRNHPEDAIQKTVVEWLQVMENLGRLTYFAIANKPRNAASGAREKQLGSRAGTPDLCILAKAHIPLFIEMKAPKGRTSFEQVSAMHRLDTVGGAVCVVCRSPDDVREVVSRWLSTTITATRVA